MSDLVTITDFLVDVGLDIWKFMTSGWFLMSLVAIRFILPKLFSLFKKTMGR